MDTPMLITDCYVANPVFPYTYFPISDAKDRVDAFLLYTEKYQNPEAINGDCMLAHFTGQYIGEMKSAEIDAMTTEIKNELKMDYMDWGYTCGRCLVTIGLKDLPLVYKIVKAFVSRGRRIYMQDTTQTTFPAFCEPSYELQQKLVLETLTATIKAGITDLFTCFHAPAHRSKFWTIPGGKELATKLRELSRRKDELSDFIGEFFAEGARKPPADKAAAAAASDKKDEPDAAPAPMDCQPSPAVVDKKDEPVPMHTTCCICLEDPVETMVLPCEHAVICRACSNKLKLDKNNMHKCVSCGQPITQVVD